MKKTKEARNLIIGMSLGDGYINPNGYLSMRHCIKQKEYIEWKKSKLNSMGINTTEVYEVKNNGYGVYELRTYNNKYMKLYRKILYTPKKNIANRKLLNRLSPLELAIWYMDDGGLSQKKKNGKVHANDLMINTHLTKEQNQIIIDYFMEKWNIKFTQVKNKGLYRIRCGTREARKFIEIVRPYVEEVKCMHHKINIKK